MVTNPELEDGQLVARRVGWEDVAALVGVVLGVWDGVVEAFAGGVVDHGERRACVHDGCVVGNGEVVVFDGGFFRLGVKRCQ